MSTTPGDGTAAASVPMALGVKEEDPLAPVLEVVSDPEALVEELVETGYAAAKAPTDFPANGDPVEKMDLMAEALLVQGLEVEANTRIVAEFIHDSGLASSLPMATTSIPISRRPMGIPSPWTAEDCEWVQMTGNWIL